RALGQPRADAVLVQVDRRRIGLGVVLADVLDEAAVPRGALVGDDDPPDRVLLAAHTGEPQSYCQRKSSRRCLEKPTGEGSGRERAAFARPYCPPRMSAPRSGILPRPTWRMILRIWSNCLTSWLTAWTLVPEPLAMRRRREPLMSSGRRRSSGVLDRMIARTRRGSRPT